MNADRPPQRQTQTQMQTGAAALAEPGQLTSNEILRGAREVTILHAGEIYRLRLTSNDRLILTK